MAWRVEDDYFQRAKSEGLVVDDVSGGFDWRYDKGQAEEASLEFGMFSFAAIQLMQEHLRCREALGYVAVVGEMIEMPVGQPQPDEFPAAVGGLIQQRINCMVRSVKENSLFFKFIGNEEGIGLRHTAGVC